MQVASRKEPAIKQAEDNLVTLTKDYDYLEKWERNTKLEWSDPTSRVLGAPYCYPRRSSSITENEFTEDWALVAIHNKIF